MRTDQQTILFYAINGIGLGHVVRLSCVARMVGIRHPAVRRFFYSNSPQADAYFDCVGIKIRDSLADPLSLRRERIMTGLSQAKAAIRPNVMVCDTHWPKAFIRESREQGVRTVLVLRGLSSDAMRDALERACSEFDAIIVPHHPDELRWQYAGSPVLDQLKHPRVAITGPIARVSQRPCGRRKVLFTLGGGGEYDGASKANSLKIYLSAFSDAIKRIERQDIFCALAAGPFLRANALRRWWHPIINTSELHEDLGPETVVVARPGYNTCWEAIGAGARLVLCGDHATLEDTEKRAEYLSRQGAAIRSKTRGKEIAKAVSECYAVPKPQIQWLRESVNAGLPLAAKIVTGNEES